MCRAWFTPESAAISMAKQLLYSRYQRRDLYLPFKYHALIGRRDAGKVCDEIFQCCNGHAAFHVHIELGAGGKFESDFDHGVGERVFD